MDDFALPEGEFAHMSNPWGVQASRINTGAVFQAVIIRIFAPNLLSFQHRSFSCFGIQSRECLLPFQRRCLRFGFCSLFFGFFLLQRSFPALFSNSISMDCSFYAYSSNFFFCFRVTSFFLMWGQPESPGYGVTSMDLRIGDARSRG